MIVAGTLVIRFDWWIVDPIVTLLIAAYILWHAFSEIGSAIRMLMLAVPDDIDLTEMTGVMASVPGVCGIHHVHLWAIDEHRTAVEAHAVVADDTRREADAIRARLCEMLKSRFGIGHATLQIEHASAACERPA